MAGDSDIPYKEGYLWIPPNGQVKKKLWQKKFCQLFCASKRGVDRLEVYDSEENASKTLSCTIVTLEDCIKIIQDPQKTQPHVFTVVTKTKIHYFAASSENDMHDWISAFQSVAFQDTASRQTIEEDNDLYCSSGGDTGIYKVTLVPTDASKRCKLTPGEYTLIVSTAALQLRMTNDNSLLFTWPYRYIRRYGHKKRRFTFEAGRKCVSGEGTFDLEHPSPQEIFKMMGTRMMCMKQLLSSRDNLLGDSQFQYALQMNARSRSPLPPSPTSTTPIPLPPRKPQRKNPPQPKVEVEPKVEPRKHSLPTPSLDHRDGGRIFINEKSSNNYDKLNHFGSMPKINLDPTYTQVNLSSDWSSPQVVEDHGGYGMIKKKSQADHAISNGTEYAIVCKPHRV
uniref:Downstream of kinase n=1 Tax=Riptortus pedestris TaxID=329032 RepID=R4WR24_RIPPE|nr:downstream of kinase [Riptortus pedestris]